jgi:hypothetical protein
VRNFQNKFDLLQKLDFQKKAFKTDSRITQYFRESSADCNSKDVLVIGHEGYSKISIHKWDVDNCRYKKEQFLVLG